MNPLAMRELKFSIGDVRVSQVVNVHETDFYVVSCFSASVGVGRVVHHAGGSHVAFEEAALLEDRAWRERLAAQQLVKVNEDLRSAVAAFSTVLLATGAAS